MAISQTHQVKIHNRTLHIMTYQVLRMSHYKQYKTNQQMPITILPNKVNNDKCDMLNDNIENQINPPTQEMINDNGELIYKYM